MEQEYGANSRSDRIHVWLMAYNGIVILVLAMFMAATQEHIGKLAGAREFLYRLPMVPVPAGELLLGAVVSFTVLVCCSYVYSNVSRLPRWFRYCVFALEVGACIFLLSSLKLSYDGVVLLLLADFMYCYQGEQQLKIMLVMMAVLYGIISFSMWSMGQQMISFDMYLNMYSTETRNLMLALKSLAGYGNIMLFVVYMATLLQDVSQEKAEIADLNYRMIKTNELLQESNNRVHASNKNLHKANQKLREYAMTIASLTEIKERNRLAREIHDTLGHALTGMITGLDACIMTMDCAPEVAKRQLGKIQEAAKKGIVDVRRSMHMLRPDDLERLTTREALEKLVEDFAAASMVEASLEIDNLPENLREDQAETVYRIVQEGLTNATRHGHATRVKVFVLGGGERLNIIISDNGIGCSNIKKGFGLTHMAERLQMLGGSVKYWSEKGFVLEAALPLNIEGGKALIRIVVADDQELMRESLQIVLDLNEDMQVVGAASNGVELLELLEHQKADVILMDVRMPGMDGVQATKAVKNKYPEMKIIILTTFDDDEYVLNGLKYGASGYLLKGMSIPDLSAAIRKVVSGGAMLNTEIVTKVVKLFSNITAAGQPARPTIEDEEFTIAVDSQGAKELTRMERNIVRLVGHGMSNREIAEKMNFSEGTVRNTVSLILSKLALRDRTQLAIWAVQTGLARERLEL